MTRPNAAAPAQSSRSGLGTTFTAGTTTISAWVPQRCSPTIANRAQKGVSPRTHAAQAPHEVDGSITTSSPVAMPATSVPTDVHDAGPVGATDVRQRRRTREAAGHPQVEVVQGRRTERHANVVRPGFGRGGVPERVGLGAGDVV